MLYNYYEFNNLNYYFHLFKLFYIGRNAAQCKVFVAFMNEGWCNSKECEYEFNIALGTALEKSYVNEYYYYYYCDYLENYL